ncbi:MAG TPA: PAS domain S-box protein [Terracidiphilus sp.]|nr:PAS domain S-box protein [Terracidiphilus sp.]
MPNQTPADSASVAPHHQAAASLYALIESTEDLICSVDLDFRILTFNSSLQRHFARNFGTQIAIGKLPEDLLPPERAAMYRALFQRALAGGPFRTQVAGQDDQVIEVSLFPIVVEGKTTGLSIFGKDITDRDRRERELRETADFLKETQRIGAVGSYVLDIASGRWTSSNVLDELFGIGSDYGRTVEGWAALVHPDDRAMMAAYFACEVVGEKKEFDKEYRIVRVNDQAERWLHGMGRLEFDALEEPVKMRGLIRDITERKRAEMQIRESEQRYRATFEQAAVGIVHTSLDGHILRCNERFAEITGYPLDELRGLTFQQLTQPQDMDESVGVVKQMLEGALGTASLEKRYLRKDGSLTWVRLTVSIQHDGGGRAQHFITVVEDINARKAAEESLARVQEALRTSEAHYRTVFQTSLDGICISRLTDGRFLDANKAFLDLMGIEREEVVGYTSLQLNFWADPGVRGEMFEVLLRDSSFRDWETQFIRKDGKLIWIQLSASLIEIDGVPCILSLVRDTSDAKAGEERLAAAQEALRLSEKRYRTAFQTSLDAININRLSDGQFIECNKAFLDIIGFARNEVIGRTALELGIWVDPADRKRMADQVSRKSIFRDLEARFRKKNGDIFWGLMSASRIEIEGVACVLSITRDISEAKAAEQRLAEAAEALRVSEERYRKVFQTSLDPITINRIDNKQYLDVNQAFLHVMGFERDEVIGKVPLDLNIWTDPRDLVNLADTLHETGECRNREIQFTRKDGSTVWGLMSASIIEIGGIPCALTITRDISSAKAAEDEIRSLAFYDTLTGLPNRRLLLERLHQAMAASSRTGRMRALLFVDLDNFKTLNDTLGHQTGDLLLHAAAHRLAVCVSDADTVGRLGGDEFVLMLEDLSEIPEEAAAQAKTVGEKVLTTIAQPYLLDGRECRSSASIGISVFGDRRESAKEILQQADIAMYQAKAAGRNTMRFFAPALQAAVNARAAMEDDLRVALQTSQFVLYFQPQIDRNRLAGAEALIRWKHPWRNILPPGEFIPLAEETDLILPLGKWVLEAACAQIAAWAGHKPAARLSLAINISARQFRQPDFVEQVLSALERTGANPRNLRLELTESMLVESVEEVIGKMTELKAHGLRFSLDDFGTGYSSLAYLKRLPLDQLKIDRSFIRDILREESSAAIAQTIISLSRAMGLPVIAEGVETEEQRDFLARLGCHAFQGYLFSRPLPLDEFQKQWLAPARDALPATG